MARKIEYAITLQADELVLDIDELYGICSQLDAIAQGWGMPFTVHIIEEKEVTLWENVQQGSVKIKPSEKLACGL